MTISEALPEDGPALLRLAGSLGLDYNGMEADRFWIAKTEGRLAGIVGLKRHADCRELVALGVDPAFRSRGLGRTLIEALMAGAEGDVYLATIIPEFFERCGFRKVQDAPAGMAKNPAWCEGCPKERCTIMRRVGR
jgi:N-acetylglutamate synthase-like GNAT family acetyltransferase